MTLLASDSCQRIVAPGGVGTMDNPAGGAYTFVGGHPGMYSVNGSAIVIHGVGQAGGGTDTETLTTGSAFSVNDFDLTTPITLTQAAAGDRTQVYVYARYQSTTASYRARLDFFTTGVVWLFLEKVSGSASILDGPFIVTNSYVAGTEILVRVYVVNAKIAAQAWLANTQARPAWAVGPVIDQSITGPGGIGFRLNMLTNSTSTPDLKIRGWQVTDAVDKVGVWGVSQGHIYDTYTDAETARYLATMMEMGVGYVRTDLKTVTDDPSDSVPFNRALLDGFATACATAGVRWFANLHMNSSVNGQIVVPQRNGVLGDPVGAGGMQGWYHFIYTAVLRYGPGGAFKPAGWQPITQYEIWNEPNNANGSGGRVDDASATVSNGFTGGGPGVALDMAYVDMYEILRCAKLALTDAWVALGANGSPTIIGLALGQIDVPYLKGLVDWAAANSKPNPLTLMTGVSCHIYPSTPVTDAAGSLVPVNPVAGQVDMANAKGWATLQTLRTYLDGAGGVATRIYVTENTYSGNDTYNTYLGNIGALTNVVWASASRASAGQLSQEQANTDAFNLVHSHPAWHVDGIFHFQMIDDETETGSSTNLTSQSFGLWHDTPNDAWALPLPTGYWKAWATRLDSLMATYGYHYGATATQRLTATAGDQDFALATASDHEATEITDS